MSRSEIAQMTLDILNGKVDTYSNEDGEKRLKDYILKEMGGTWDYYSFQENKYKVYISDLTVLNMDKRSI